MVALTERAVKKLGTLLGELNAANSSNLLESRSEQYKDDLGETAHREYSAPRELTDNLNVAFQHWISQMNSAYSRMDTPRSNGCWHADGIDGYRDAERTFCFHARRLALYVEYYSSIQDVKPLYGPLQKILDTLDGKEIAVKEKRRPVNRTVRPKRTDVTTAPECQASMTSSPMPPAQ